MYVKSDNNYSYIECYSRDGQFMMIIRWELGRTSLSSNLKYLYIEYNNTMRKLNKEISKVYSNYENNGIDLDIFLTFIENLNSLCILDLYHNKLSTLSDAINNLKYLQILTLSNNNFSTLPDSIGNLKNLENLDLSQNHSFQNYLIL
ncbi:hypothetical protein BCR32DRAFT_247947 [Anaeromyces robustus]|uniref:L domain-like protein n=1 Tax=Anaeromyces robustus TaxID=1754192 RepID=A0A1Y1WVH6_9FUNG|nr:hypothetical protein BCR32DRAFT_247947 [Anaeromyces robustus]|eukprot:ORX77405.1 hypothetical protein BCR32DRAFT_247947 [Anaeromyces robustus]